MSNFTTIETINNQATVDRTGEVLGPTWTSSNSPAKLVSKQGPFQFTGDDSEIATSVSALIDSSKERLFISTQSFSDTSIIHAIETALGRGVRVYMVVDSPGFESMLNNPSCNALHGSVLLRERVDRGLDLVIADWHLADRTGFLLSTPLDGTLNSNAEGWAMELSKSQIDEFSAHIQHEFWSITDGREVLSPDEAKNPRPIAEAPFTLRAIQNRDHILRASLASDGDDSKAEATLRKEKKWEGQIMGSSEHSSILLQGEAIEVGTDAAQVIHSSPQNTDPATGQFAHSGLSLQLAIGAESYLAGWDRAANGDWHSILRLTADQAKAAKALLQKYCKSPEWIGHSKIKLGEAGNHIIRNGQEFRINDNQIIDLGVVHLEDMPDSAEALETHQPPMNPPASSLARQCTFQWTSAPPVAPASASKDDLHAVWEGIRGELQTRLDALDDLNQPSKIPGFGRKAKELQKLINTARETSVTVSDPKSLSTLIDMVEALTESVGGNLADIKAAEDEAARAALEKEQREAHKVAVADAKKTIKDISGRLEKSNREFKQLKTDGEKAEGVEKKRIESDLSQLGPKIKQMESDLRQAKEVSSSTFKFNPPASLGTSKKGESKVHKFLGDTNQSKLKIKVPSEALPAAGTVYRDGENRYLAILNWEEVEQGRTDAKRLKATLCAAREVLS